MANPIIDGLAQIESTGFIGETAAWNGLQALEKGELQGEAADSMRANLRNYRSNMKERGQRYAFPTFERERQEEETKYYREAFGGIDRMRAVVDPEAIKGVEMDVGTSGDDPNERLMDEVTFAFLADRTGIDERKLGENIDAVREQYAAEVLGVPGVKTSKAFYEAMSSSYENSDKQAAVAGRIAEMAMNAAAETPDSTMGPMGTKGMSFEAMVKDWTGIQGDADFDGKNAATYKEVYRKTFEKSKEAYAKAEPVATRIMGMLEAAASSDENDFLGTGETGAFGMLGALGEVLKEGGTLADMDKVAFLIAKRLKDVSGDQGGTTGGMGRSWGRGIDDIVLNVTTSLAAPAERAMQDLKDGKDIWVTKLTPGMSRQEILAAVALGGGAENAPGAADRFMGRMAVKAGGMGVLRKLTDEERAELKDIVEPISKAAEMIQFLKKAREGSDPIKPDNKWIPDAVEVGLFDASRSGPYTALSMMPYGLGTIISQKSMAEDSYRNILANDPTANRNSARTAADISGWGQALVERYVDRAILFGRTPNLGNVLTKLGLQNGFARFGAATLAKAGAEFGEEKVQDLTDAAAVDVVAALNKDMKGTDWEGFRKSFFDAGGNLRTFMAVLPLALIGAGKFTIEDVKDGNKLTQDKATLKAVIGDEKKAAAIAQEQDLTKREQMIRDAWESRGTDALADTAAEAGAAQERAQAAGTVVEGAGGAQAAQNGATEQTDTRSAQERAQAADAVADTENAAAGSGAAVGYAVEQSATGPQIVETRRDGLDELAHDEAIFEQAERAGVLPTIRPLEEGYRVEFPDGEGGMDVPTLDDATHTVGQWMENRSEREREAAVEWGQWLEMFHVEQTLDDQTGIAMDIGKRAKGDPMLLAQLEERAALEGVPFDDRVRIFGESERVLQNRRAHFVAKLYKGANPMDAAEEFAEGFLRRSFQDGTHSVNEVLGMMRQFEAASGTQVVKSQSTQGVVEAFSDLARGYVAGNIDADAVPAKMKAWFKSMVFFLGDVFKLTGQLLKFSRDVERGKAIKETKAAGALDRDLEALLKMATGLDMAAFERRMMAEDVDMDGMLDPESEISEMVKGRIPRPSDLKGDKRTNYFGEVSRIWEGMTKEAGGERRKGDGRKKLSMSAANAFFAPPGQGMPLDDLRVFLNERGFEFDTIDEMLVAVEDSQGGRFQYATSANMTEEERASFSVDAYGMDHRPTDYGPRAHDLAEGDLMPDDVYDHPEWYSAMSPKVIRESIAQLNKVRGKPDAPVTIYRAGPSPEMNPGDWVTLSKEYARTHGMSFEPEEGAKVWAIQVPASSVRWSMDDISEFGYFGDQVLAEDTGTTFSIGLADQDGGGAVDPEEAREVVADAEGYWSGVMKNRRVFDRMAAGYVVELAPKEELQRLKARQYEVMEIGPTADAARREIENAGTFEDAVAVVLGDADSIHPRVKVIMANMLRGMALERKTEQGYDLAAALTDRLAEVATEAGQIVEAFKYLGSSFGTTEGALAWVKRQLKKAKKAAIPADQLEATKNSVADVMKQANALFNDWVNEALGIKKTRERKEKIDGYRMEDIPDVTFSLDAGMRPLIPWAVQTMQELGADAIDSLLLQKYGDAIKPHLADVKIEAMKRLKAPRKPHKPKGKKEEKPGGRPSPEQRDRWEGREREPNTFEPRVQPDLLPGEERQEPARPRDGVTDEQRQGWEGGELGLDIEDFKGLLVSKVIKKLRIRNIDTPRRAREAVDSILKEVTGAGMNADQVRQVIDRVYAEKYKLPTMNAALIKKVEEHSQRIGRTPADSIARRQATVEFMDFIHDTMKGVDWLDVGWSVWYANILSGYNTHLRNIGDSGLQVLADTAFSTLTANPLNWIENMKEAMAGMRDGFGRGVGESLRHIRTGEALVARETESKFGARGALERKKLWPIFNLLKYVPRLLVAEDYLMYAGALEAKARLVALEIARAEGLENKEARDRIQSILNLSPERITDFKERAETEWDGMEPGDYRGTRDEWVKRRVKELQVMTRDGDLLERSSEFAARATYNYKPEGVLGVIAEGFGMVLHGMSDKSGLEKYGWKGDVVKGISQSGKFLMPFVRIVANVLNKQLDYSPVGLLRAVLPATVELKGGKVVAKDKTADARAMELKKGVVGTLIIIGMLARTPDDDDNLFEIHGAGPTDFNKANQLRATGWMPNSIQIGGRYIGYKNTPLAALFSVLGNSYDAERYDGGRDNVDALTKFAYGMVDAGQVILDASFLSSMSDFLTIASRKGESTARAMERFLTRTLSPSNAIPFANLWKQANADFDSRLRDRVGMKAELAAAVPVVSGSNDAKLDALGDEIDGRAFGWLWSKERAGSGEARIWRMIADKEAWLPNTWSYQNKMSPEQFRNFQIERGRFIKERLLANDGRLLRSMEAMNEERAQERMEKLTRDATDQAKKRVGYKPVKK